LEYYSSSLHSSVADSYSSGPETLCERNTKFIALFTTAHQFTRSCASSINSKS